MSGTTQVTRSEKRKEIHSDTTAKELRAVLPMTDPSRSSLLNPLKKPKESSNDLRNKPEQQKRESRRFKMSRICCGRDNASTRGTDFSKLERLVCANCNKKKVLKKKGGERNLNFPSCSPDVQAPVRNKRRVEWTNLTNLNAGIILAGEEVRQLKEAGCKIYPMQWVDTDKNAQL